MVIVRNQTQRAKLTRLGEDEREQVRRRLKAGERPEALAVEFDVHFNTIRNIAKEAKRPTP
jgi:DNA invertase Pin-like site-specific DNA recombinase